jgi:hypothetical protein
VYSLFESTLTNQDDKAEVIVVNNVATDDEIKNKKKAARCNRRVEEEHKVVDEHRLALYELIKAKKNLKGDNSSESSMENYANKRKVMLKKNKNNDG